MLMAGKISPRSTEPAPVSVTALREAIEAIGSQSALARLLKVTQGAVSKWVSGRKPLAAEHVLAVEAATSVSRHRLRPDIYGPEPSGDTVGHGDQPHLEPTR